MRTFFKVLPEGVTMEIVMEWDQYCNMWDELPVELKMLPIGEFWRHPDLARRFSNGCAHISKTAMYWASFPIGNVDLERAFAIMRAMEGSQRYSLKGESVRTELRVKVNGWLVDELLAVAAATVHK